MILSIGAKTVLLAFMAAFNFDLPKFINATTSLFSYERYCYSTACIYVPCARPCASNVK